MGPIRWVPNFIDFMIMSISVYVQLNSNAHTDAHSMPVRLIGIESRRDEIGICPWAGPSVVARAEIVSHQTKSLIRAGNAAACVTHHVTTERSRIACLSIRRRFIHGVQKKTPTCVFDNNSNISWAIFIINFCTNRNRNEYATIIYLMAWWRHKCVKQTSQSSLHRVNDEHWTTSLSSWKTPTFSIINLAFLSRFFILFITVNKNWYSSENWQNLHHHRNWVSTVPNTKTAFFETTVADRFLQCVRSNRLFAALTFSRVFDYDFSPKLDIFNARANSLK